MAGRSSGKLVLALNPPVRCLRQQVGAGVGGRESRLGDQSVEGRPDLGVDRVFDTENERVELAVGDHAHAHFAPEAPLVGVKFPDRLEPLAAGILDDLIGRELAVGTAVPLGGRVDPGAIIIEGLGRQCQLASRHAGPVEVFLGDDRHEDPIFLFVHRDRPVLGNARGQAVLGRLEGLGRQQVGHRIGSGQ